MRKKHCIFILCFSLSLKICVAQDSTKIHELIQRIAEQQITADDFFLPGIFPSYISQNEKYSEHKKDNNIFFSALIAYTLIELKPYVNKRDQSTIDSILAKEKPLFKKFKNKNGRDTYNFWRTDSIYKYPYSSALPFFTKNISLPDDMDDTVFSLLALNTDDSTAEGVHTLMQSYVNSDTNKVRTVIDAYQNFSAYSTWFGKKFPVVFDVSVLCNVLTFVQSHQLQWTTADSASLKVIIATIGNDYHINQPLYASPYYGKTSLILYHVARLMSIKKIPELEALKVKLLADAVKEFAHSENLLERIILSSVILKLGYIPPAITILHAEISDKIEKNDFCFFIGNVPSYFHNAFRKYATNKNIWLFYHYCPAWNDALLLEYLVLKKN